MSDPEDFLEAQQQQLNRSLFSTEYMEVLILAATLLATVVISALTLRQTTHHFEIERTSAFVERLDSSDMVQLRENVDRWLAAGETPAELYARSVSEDAQAQNNAVDTIVQLRTLCNFFDEFGAAIRIASIDENYASELLGSVCIHYAQALEPFIIESRSQHQRPNLFDDVFYLKDRMKKLDSRKNR